MALTVPGVVYDQLPGKSRTLLRALIINLHTMAGTFGGSKSYFTPAGRPYSHFGLRGDGYGEQWQDLNFRAASDLDGNPISCSIETEDTGRYFPAWGGSNVPPWTPAQVEWLVVVLAWLCVRLGIPPQLTPDSLPGRTGVSWHRLGIDPWRVAGGIRYSSARGKVCPGDARIAQLVSTIIPRVAALVAGVGPNPPATLEVFLMYAIRAKDDVRPWAICSDNGDVSLFGDPAWARPGDQVLPNEYYWAQARAGAFRTEPGSGNAITVSAGDWDACVAATRARRNVLVSTLDPKLNPRRIVWAADAPDAVYITDGILKAEIEGWGNVTVSWYADFAEYDREKNEPFAIPNAALDQIPLVPVDAFLAPPAAK